MSGQSRASSAGTASVPALEVSRLSKTFESHTVLRELGLTLASGEIHVLVGENGSGKSTLIKVLSGLHQPDRGGAVRIGGESLTFGSPSESRRLGARFVHQDLGLIESLTVLDNVLLGSGYPSRAGTIRGAAARESATQLLGRVGLHVDPRRLLGDLSAAERTGVAVARALRGDLAAPARLLVLDEPTASLPLTEVERLLEIVRDAARAGVAVLFVTHHLDEVFEIGHRVTVLRDGRVVSTSAAESVDRGALVRLMVGEHFEEGLPPRRALPETAEPCLTVDGLVADGVQGVSLEVAAGEIVGVAGLTGSGRDTLLGATFGAIRRKRGEVAVRGEVVRPDRPEESIAHGMCYLPPDRKRQSGLMGLSARENLTLADLDPLGSPLWLDGRCESDEARRWFARLDVRPKGELGAPLASFSGGNQQKILLGKWMRLKPAVFLLDDPTQGVDIGAKAEVHQHLVEMARDGAAIVVASSDVEELPAICDRVIVLRRGRIADELRGDRVRLSEIKERIVSERSPAASGSATGMAWS